MEMDFYILIAVIAIYFIGFCIAVYVLRDELGEETENIIGNVYSKTYMDICLKAMCWPLLILLIILFGPFMIVSQLILNLNKK